MASVETDFGTKQAARNANPDIHPVFQATKDTSRLLCTPSLQKFAELNLQEAGVGRNSPPMSYQIEEIEGIGPANATKLAKAEITNTEHLLAKCADAAGRKTVGETTGFDASTLLKWANMADLMRIKGIGSEYSELLEAAGVDTVKELRNRNAANLAAKMEEVNSAKKLTRKVPTEAMATEWIDQAKSLEPLITH